MKCKIAVLAGDGIGPEIMAEALRVLERVGDCFGHSFEISEGLVGGAAYERYEKHFPDETKNICRAANAILFGTVGGPVSAAHLPKWNNCERESILALRKTFQFFANLRPVRIYSELADSSPLRAEIIRGGIDLLVVRELLGDIYFGKRGTENREGKRYAYDMAEYTEDQISAIARVAFESARKRKKHVTSVDKANVMESSRLWRAVVREIAQEYPDVALTEMLVDNCAMQLVARPSQFDVIVTSNLFGDILSDAAAVLPGSLGLLASASLNAEGFGLFEPPGGSAPDIAGQGKSNPIGQILSAAMMLRYAFQLEKEARAVEAAVLSAIQSGKRTSDIIGQSDIQPVTTRQMGEAVLSFLDS